MRKKQQRYTPEFKAEAVKLVLEQGIQQSLAARRLGIPEGTLATWVATAKLSLQPSAPGSRSAPEKTLNFARSWLRLVWSVIS